MPCTGDCGRSSSTSIDPCVLDPHPSISCDSFVADMIKKLSEIKRCYCGKRDKKEFRQGIGSECYEDCKALNFQTYRGTFFFNNFHHDGEYFINKNRELMFYHGLFHLNKLEGYAQSVCGHHYVFEGLYKENSRFGPGILYHSNETAEVGFWHGNQLMRILQRDPDIVIPKVASTLDGIRTLHNYRAVIKVPFEVEDIAKDVMSHLNFPCYLRERSDELYNEKIRNVNSIFTNRKLYDETFFGKDYENVAAKVFSRRSTVVPCGNDDEDLEICQNCFQVLLKEDRIDKLLRETENLRKRIKKLEQQKKELQNYIEDCLACCGVMSDVVAETESNDYYDLRNFPNYIQNIDDISALTNYEKILQIYDFDVQQTIVPKRFDDRNNPINYYQPKRKILLYTRDNPTVQVSHTVTNYPKKSSLDRLSHIRFSRAPKYLLSDTCICQNCREDFDMSTKKLPDLDYTINFYEMVLHLLTEKLNREYDHILTETTETKFMRIPPILAWNNSETFQEMTKHIFRFYFMEDFVSFKVEDFLQNNRSNFPPPGILEDNIKKFFKICWEGKLSTALAIYDKYKINPDVCDIDGNTAMMYATIHQNHKAFEMLVELGANINFFNDEGITPLAMSILLYLEEKYRVTDWEKGFLDHIPFPNSAGCTIFPSDPEEDPENASEKTTTIKSTRKSKRNLNKEYIFDTSYKQKQKRKKPRSKKSGRTIPSSCNEKSVTESESLYRKRMMIHEILSFGADAKICLVPLPVIITVLYTEKIDILAKVLKNNADPCQTTPKIALAPLHILSTMTPSTIISQMAELLLKFRAYPNQRTSPDFWAEINKDFIPKKNSIICEATELVVEGKTPLHIIAIREDFTECHFEHIPLFIQTLVDKGADPNLKFLGLTPMALAIIRRSPLLILSLLQTPLVNPYEPLYYCMGNIFSILAIPFGKGNIDVKRTKAFINFLIDNRLNPLYSIGKLDNVYLYFEEQEERKKEIEAASKKKKRKKKPKIELQIDEIKKHLKTAGRSVLMTHVLCRRTLELYQLRMAGIDYPGMNFILAHLRLSLFKSYITTSYDYGLLQRNQIDLNLMESFFNVLSKTAVDFSEVSEFYGELFMDRTQPKSILPLIELDENEEVFDKCFHCLKNGTPTNRLLYCPLCETVAYCSAKCNKANKKCKIHRCNYTFYKPLRESLGDKRPQPLVMPALLELAKLLQIEKESFVKYAEINDLFEQTRFKPDSIRLKVEAARDEFLELLKSRMAFTVKNKLRLYLQKNLKQMYGRYGKLPKWLKEWNRKDRRILHRAQCRGYPLLFRRIAPPRPKYDEEQLAPSGKSTPKSSGKTSAKSSAKSSPR